VNTTEWFVVGFFGGFIAINLLAPHLGERILDWLDERRRR
jgi:hypothetical protein